MFLWNFFVTHWSICYNSVLQYLCSVVVTGHVVQVTFNISNGLKPSDASPSLTLRGSNAKCWYVSSTCFQAKELAWCRTLPSLINSFVCQCIYADVISFIYNLCSRGISGKYLRILRGTFFFLTLPSSTSSVCMFPLTLLTYWTFVELLVLPRK